MSSIISDIAEAVKDRINSGSYAYPETVAAVRKYLPSYDKIDLPTVTVMVAPKAWSAEILDRNQNDETLRIDVGIYRTIDADTEADIDALMELVGEIRTRLNRFSPATTPRGFWLRTDNVPIFDQVFLRENQIFASLLTVSYRVFQ